MLYVSKHPPDLVVEVAITHESKEKQLIYRRKEVPELWQVDTRGEKMTVTFLDLQAMPAPRALDTSLALPDIGPTHVTRAIELFRHPGISTNYVKSYYAIRSLLEQEKAIEEIPQQQQRYDFER